MSKTKKSEESARRVFALAAMNMSWQLAIVVLVPVVGGYKLDENFGSLPLLTMVGLVIATICVMLVLHRQLEQLGTLKDDGGKS